MKLPAAMIREIERLGEDQAQYEYWAAQQGLRFAQIMLKDALDTEALFNKWFPRLQEFEQSSRIRNPMSDEHSLSKLDRAVRRILEPKIEQGVLPQLSRFRVPILSAPLPVLSLVKTQWSRIYSQPIFLTPHELNQWSSICTEPDDSPWWNFYYNWNATPDPDEDEWKKDADYTVPPGTTPLLVSWGHCVSGLAGGRTTELWCVDREGYEKLIGPVSWDIW